MATSIPDSVRRSRSGRKSAEEIESYESVNVADVLKDSEPAEEAWIHMRAITHPPRLLGASEELARELGVSQGAVRALRQLVGAGTMPMSRLAGQLHCDGSYVTGLIDVLEDAGLAERQHDAHDRRVKVVALTDKGRKVALRARALLITPPESFSVLSAAELKTLLGLLRKVRAAETPDNTIGES